MLSIQFFLSLALAQIKILESTMGPETESDWTDHYGNNIFCLSDTVAWAVLGLPESDEKWLFRQAFTETHHWSQTCMVSWGPGRWCPPPEMRGGECPVGWDDTLNETVWPFRQTIKHYKTPFNWKCLDVSVSTNYLLPSKSYDLLRYKFKKHEWNFEISFGEITFVHACLPM